MNPPSLTPRRPSFRCPSGPMSGLMNHHMRTQSTRKLPRVSLEASFNAAASEQRLQRFTVAIALGRRPSRPSKLAVPFQTGTASSMLLPWPRTWRESGRRRWWHWARVGLIDVRLESSACTAPQRASLRGQLDINSTLPCSHHGCQRRFNCAHSALLSAPGAHAGRLPVSTAHA